MKTAHVYKEKSSNRYSSARGFSLLEMVIVMGIIALILGGAIGVMGKMGEGAKFTRFDGDVAAFGSSLKMYKLAAGSYPTSQQGLISLVEKPTAAPVPRRWTKLADKLVQDPWENDYIYRRNGKIDPNDFEIVSKGPDGQLNTDDDLSSQSVGQ